MKRRIVIVDDFENTRWVIEFTLKKLDAEIMKASNGREALAYFDGKPIDLLLTDLNMPEMDGIELVRRVKALEAYKRMPVIMLTTEKNPEMKKLASQLNITAWVQKPFKNEDFLKIVNRCLALAR